MQRKLHFIIIQDKVLWDYEIDYQRNSTHVSLKKTQVFTLRSWHLHPPNRINYLWSFFLYIVLARTHPCDTASSFVIQGMMEFIGSDHGIGKKKVLYALLELVSADVNNFLLIFFLLYS